MTGCENREITTEPEEQERQMKRPAPRTNSIETFTKLEDIDARLRTVFFEIKRIEVRSLDLLRSQY